jgi:hypothetical protein
MPPEEDVVRIVEWPEGPALLQHQFEKTPAHLVVETWPQDPVHVDMAMNVVAREQIPVCIRVCEPICAQSEYTIAIDIFDRPVAAINIKGMTRLFNCREEG